LLLAVVEDVDDGGVQDADVAVVQGADER